MRWAFVALGASLQACEDEVGFETPFISCSVARTVPGYCGRNDSYSTSVRWYRKLQLTLCGEKLDTCMELCKCRALCAGNTLVMWQGREPECMYKKRANAMSIKILKEPPEPVQPLKCGGCIWGRWDGCKQLCFFPKCVRYKKRDRRETND